VPLVCGGVDSNSNTLASCEQYRDGQWKSFAAMPQNLSMFGMATLNEKPHVFGGMLPNGSQSNSVYVYDHGLLAILS
jgi:hypothetical protein